MLFRILVFIVLLFTALFYPFWVLTTLGILSIVYFPRYYEGVTVFFLSDLLYGFDGGRFGGIYFISGISAIIAFFIIEFLKEKIRISKQIEI